MDAPRAFEQTFDVSETDIDELGHASNIAYVRWIQDVAVAHSEAVGLGIEAYKQLGAIFVIVRHEIDYLRPAFRGDRVVARTWLGTVMAAKCQRRTELLRERDGVALARGSTWWGFIDVTRGRPRRIPDTVRGAFAEYLSHEARRSPLPSTTE